VRSFIAEASIIH